MNEIVTNLIAPTLEPEVPQHLLPFVSSVQASDIGKLWGPLLSLQSQHRQSGTTRTARTRRLTARKTSLCTRPSGEQVVKALSTTRRTTPWTKWRERDGTARVSAETRGAYSLVGIILLTSYRIGWIIHEHDTHNLLVAGGVCDSHLPLLTLAALGKSTCTATTTSCRRENDHHGLLNKIITSINMTCRGCVVHQQLQPWLR
jgi:hypothetical protein